MVIFSIISQDGIFVEEEHIALNKKQAIKFLNEALKELKE